MSFHRPLQTTQAEGRIEGIGQLPGDVAIDAIRCWKIALDRGISGALIGPSADLMKSPPIQYSDAQATEMLG